MSWNTRQPPTLGIKDDLKALAGAQERLRAAGVLRTNNLVGDTGEWIAARFYGVELAPPRTQGYDLVTKGGLRVRLSPQRRQ